MMDKLAAPYEEAMAEAEQAFKELPVGTRKKLGKITRNDLYTILYDKETEQETGEVVFKFAMKASGVTKKGPKAGKAWKRRPDIFDARGKLMAKVPEIWGGTVGKVSFEAGGYFIPGSGAAGLKLGLRGVQVIELVSTGGRSAESHGFEAEEGYEHTDEPTFGDTSSTADSDDDTNDTANF